MNSRIAIFLNGIQGSGKSTQLEKLEKCFGFTSAIASKVLDKKSSDDPAYQHTISLFQSQGVLVPDNITVGVLTDYLETIIDRNRLVLDGFMRTDLQAAEVVNFLAKNNYKIYIIFLHMPTDGAKTRALTRGRKDDNLETLQVRINGYFGNLPRVLEKLVLSGYSIHSVNADQGIEAVSSDILKIIGI